MHSDLCDGVYIADSSNYTQGRNGNKICKFTPHMMAGILSGKQCAVNVFGNPGRKILQCCVLINNVGLLVVYTIIIGK